VTPLASRSLARISRLHSGKNIKTLPVRMAATRAGANRSNVMLTVDIESGTVALPEAVIFGPACDRCPGTNER
jgi:hypothetical protein